MMPPTTTRNPSTAKSVPLPTPWDVTTILADGSGGTASAARSASSMIARCMGSEVRLTRLLDPAYMISRRRFAASAGVSSFASVMPIRLRGVRFACSHLDGGVVAEAEGQIVGWAAGGPNREPGPDYAGELYAIDLLPEHQRRGIGLKLRWRPPVG